MTAIITKRNAKDKAFIGGSGGGGDYPTDAEFDTIKVNKEATFTVNDENITFANHESRIKSLEQSGGGGSGDSLFTSYTGYDYFAVKNENITTGNANYWGKPYYYLSITVPDSIATKLSNNSNIIQVFNIIIRERIFYTTSAECITQFNISYQNNKFICPVITFLNTEDNHNVCSLEYKDSPFEDNLPAIFIHDDLHISPHTLYINGDMSIVYLLNQSGIQSIAKEIKCDIIDARNCFKLHESDVPYLYKPKYFKERITTEGTEHLPGGTANKILEQIGKYWTCIWEFDDKQQFVDGQTFKFEEYCFGNTFSFTWNAVKQSWVGNNVRCVQKQNVANIFDGNLAYVVAIERNTINYDIVNLTAKYVPNDGNIVQALHESGKITCYIRWGDRTETIDKVGIVYQSGYPKYLNKYKWKANNIEYDAMEFAYQWNDKHSAFNFDYLIIQISINDVTTQLVYKFRETQQQTGWIMFDVQSNTIPNLGGSYSNLLTNSTHNSKNIELHLFKDFTKPRDEINWDGVTNPFIYIIDRQFYKITPNPVGSTTLYTDFNITSSKVITADNITTMRSDLNVVSNTVDVVSWDVSKLRSDFETFAEQVEEQMKVTEVLEVVDDVLSVVDVGLAIPGVFKFFKEGGFKGIMRFFDRTNVESIADLETDIASDVTNIIDDVTDVIDPIDTLVTATNIALNTIAQNESSNTNTFDWTKAIIQLNKIRSWSKSAKSYLSFNGDYDKIHPSKSLLTFGAALEIAHQIRNTLKPVTLELTTDVIENHNDIIAAIDEIKNVRSNMVTEYDFLHCIDEVPEIDFTTGNSRIWFRFKKYINEGEITFKVTWEDSPSDFDNVKLSFVATKDEKTHVRNGYKVIEFSCPNYTAAEFSNRYSAPVIQNCNYEFTDAVCEIIIDAVQHSSSTEDDIFASVELLTSNVKTYKNKSSFKDIAYTDSFESLDERVTILEKQNLIANADIERRIAILEAKCKNISIDSDIVTHTESVTLTTEQRLRILELKCANII